MSEKIILVVPCYNEEERLNTETFMKSLDEESSLHWLFVDDGSQDKTAEVIESMRSKNPDRIFFHQLSQNSGKGEAVRQGLQKALELQATLTGYFDADLATPMSEVFRLLKIYRLRANQKFLFGSRVYLLGRKIERKYWRFLLGRCFAFVASKLLGLKVYDTQCGFKLISHFEKLPLCLDEKFKSSWLFDVELIQRLLGRGGLTTADFFEEPLHQWTDVGGSKIKTRALITALRDLFLIMMDSKKGQ